MTSNYQQLGILIDNYDVSWNRGNGLQCPWYLRTTINVSVVEATFTGHQKPHFYTGRANHPKFHSNSMVFDNHHSHHRRLFYCAHIWQVNSPSTVFRWIILFILRLNCVPALIDRSLNAVALSITSSSAYHFLFCALFHSFYIFESSLFWLLTWSNPVYIESSHSLYSSCFRYRLALRYSTSTWDTNYANIYPVRAKRIALRFYLRKRPEIKD